VLAALEAERGQGGGKRAHFVGELAPGRRLPDAEILLADRRPLRPHARVVHQQFRKRV